MSKTALITGASRGIGRAIAFAFAGHGYDLYLTCKTNIAYLMNMKEILEAEYDVTVNVFRRDMGNHEEVFKLFENLPRLDVLINNAGISYVGLLSDMSVEAWNDIMSTNLNSVFYSCKYAVPKMVAEHRGRIINISSVWGDAGASMEVAYSTSKGGVNSFTKALAKELAPSNIQVNAIACGLIDTDMNACFSDEEKAAVIEEIPADRIGQPEEVAKLTLQLAEAPEYLTGQVISLDGGWR